MPVLHTTAPSIDSGLALDRACPERGRGARAKAHGKHLLFLLLFALATQAHKPLTMFQGLAAFIAMVYAIVVNVSFRLWYKCRHRWSEHGTHECMDHPGPLPDFPKLLQSPLKLLLSRLGLPFKPGELTFVPLIDLFQKLRDAIHQFVCRNGPIVYHFRHLLPKPIYRRQRCLRQLFEHLDHQLVFSPFKGQVRFPHSDLPQLFLSASSGRS